MRYLVETFAVGALGRGQGIEQFLGAVQGAETPAIRWVGIARNWQEVPPMSKDVKRPPSRKDAVKQKVMTTDEWIQMHLRRAPERDAEWVRRALVSQGRA
ncbi:hypothetical protein [Streptomyces spiralis]|uniref:hypothetical protein n=1 Tax=Streptomyces spiralis TaxID=66376 RepID=UPI0036B9E665